MRSSASLGIYPTYPPNRANSASAPAPSQELTATQLINPGQVPRNPVPYWVEAVKGEIIRRWGSSALHYGGLKIHTTLNMAIQEAAETAIARGLTALDQQLVFKPYQLATLPQRRNYVQAALVCLSPTGAVEAMFGGRDVFASYYNRALTVRRQPG